MKVVILAGGFGTRISEYSTAIPKPMITVGGKPLIWHIMDHYSNFGYKEFVVAVGYKGDLIKQYFANYSRSYSDMTVDLSSGKILALNSPSKDWKVTLVDTGEGTMTGGRLKRLTSFLGKEPFMATYGDGISDVNIDQLVKHHEASRCAVTITAVRPAARFGELQLEGKLVSRFKEKPKSEVGWINGGFFVMEPQFLNYIEDDTTVLEQQPLESVAKEGQLCAFKHEGFWHCVDTKRDLDHLRKIWDEHGCLKVET